MFLLHRPTARDIAAFLESSKTLPCSYDAALKDGRFRGFKVDELTTVIGRGADDFERAKTAIREWRPFDVGWIEVFPVHTPIAPGTLVAVVVSHLGFWSMNGCRVVSVSDPASVHDFGFTYATLVEHAECGEETFSVSMDPQTGAVSYSIRAVSRPRAQAVGADL